MGYLDDMMNAPIINPNYGRPANLTPKEFDDPFKRGISTHYIQDDLENNVINVRNRGGDTNLLRGIGDWGGYGLDADQLALLRDAEIAWNQMGGNFVGSGALERTGRTFFDYVGMHAPEIEAALRAGRAEDYTPAQFRYDATEGVDWNKVGQLGALAAGAYFIPPLLGAGGGGAGAGGAAAGAGGGGGSASTFALGANPAPSLIAGQTTASGIPIAASGGVGTGTAAAMSSALPAGLSIGPNGLPTALATAGGGMGTMTGAVPAAGAAVSGGGGFLSRIADMLGLDGDKIKDLGGKVVDFFKDEDGLKWGRILGGSAGALALLDAMRGSQESGEPIPLPEKFNRGLTDYNFSRSQRAMPTDLARYGRDGGEHRFFTDAKFADGGGVRGPGTGRSDDIPAMLSDGEYVMDAETVSLLGDGSTDAGVRRLDELRRKLRQHKGKSLRRGQYSQKAKAPEEYMRKAKGGGVKTTKTRSKMPSIEQVASMIEQSLSDNDFKRADQLMSQLEATNRKAARRIRLSMGGKV